MKRYTSKSFKSVAMFYLGFPIVYIVAVAILFDVPANLCVRILLSPFYYFVAILAVVAGYGLWETRRWSWYALVAVNVLVAYQNALIAHDYGESHHPMLAFASSLAILAALSYRVARELRVPYFFPKIRWWESNPRYKLSVPVRLARRAPCAGGGQERPFIDGEILDLSMGGCFVKLRTELGVDEGVRLVFGVFDYPMELDGTVVWRTQSTVTHPKGVGVKFAALPRPQRRTLRLVTQRLKKIAAFYRRSRYLMNPEEFQKRFAELESQPLKERTG